MLVTFRYVPGTVPQKGTDAMANDRDPRSDLGAWLGENFAGPP